MALCMDADMHLVSGTKLEQKALDGFVAKRQY
jgi:hypothetical protein